MLVGLRQAGITPGNQFGHDADRDFGDGLRADIQADRRGDAVQIRLAHPFLAQIVEDQPDLAAAADQSDVRRPGGRQLFEGLLVMPVPTSHDQDIRKRGDLEALEHVIEGADQDFLCLGKSFTIGVLAAVVDDPDVEIGGSGQLGDGLPDVPRAHDDQPDSRPARQERDPILNRRLRPRLALRSGTTAPRERRRTADWPPMRLHRRTESACPPAARRTDPVRARLPR